MIKVKDYLEALSALLSLVVKLAFLFGLCLIALYSYWEGIPIPVRNLAEAMFVFSTVLVFSVSVVGLIISSILIGFAPAAAWRIVRRMWSGESFREAIPEGAEPLLALSAFLFLLFITALMVFPQSLEAVGNFVSVVAAGAFASSLYFQRAQIRDRKAAYVLLGFIVFVLVTVSGFGRNYVYSSMWWIGVRDSDSQVIVLSVENQDVLEDAARLGGIDPRFCPYSDGRVILLDSRVVWGGSDDLVTLRVGGNKQGEGVIIRLPIELITLPRGHTAESACDVLPHG